MSTTSISSLWPAYTHYRAAADDVSYAMFCKIHHYKHNIGKGTHIHDAKLIIPQIARLGTPESVIGTAAEYKL